MKRKLKNRFNDKRPWGSEEIFTLNEKSSVKILTFKPGKRNSLQYHHNRTEFWRFLDNSAKVTVGKRTFKVKNGSEVLVPKRANHRIHALSKPVRVLEISFGDFDEADIVRVEDDYGRV